jgi:DNA-binding response OmpR family regulator
MPLLFDAMEICRRLRAAGKIPIIMFTARTTESGELEGLRWARP